MGFRMKVNQYIRLEYILTSFLLQLNFVKYITERRQVTVNVEVLLC